MENEVETHGGGSKAMGLSKAVRGASDDAWMSEGLRGMANGEGMNEGITDSSDAGMRDRKLGLYRYRYFGNFASNSVGSKFGFRVGITKTHTQPEPASGFILKIQTRPYYFTGRVNSAH